MPDPISFFVFLFFSYWAVSLVGKLLKNRVKDECAGTISKNCDSGKSAVVGIDAGIWGKICRSKTH